MKVDGQEEHNAHTCKAFCKLSVVIFRSEAYFVHKNCSHTHDAYKSHTYSSRRCTASQRWGFGHRGNYFSEAYWLLHGWHGHLDIGLLQCHSHGSVLQQDGIISVSLGLEACISNIAVGPRVNNLRINTRNTTWQSVPYSPTVPYSHTECSIQPNRVFHAEKVPWCILPWIHQKLMCPHCILLWQKCCRSTSELLENLSAWGCNTCRRKCCCRLRQWMLLVYQIQISLRPVFQ